jgi:hypothetical protein
MKQVYLPDAAAAGPSIESEAKYFARCTICGDWFDLREFRDVYIHERWHAEGNVGLMPGHQRH